MSVRNLSIAQQAGRNLAEDTAFDCLRPTIFHEDWWLDAATGGRAEVVEVKDGQRTVGRLPYCVTSRYGLSSSNMPTLTHFLGPAVDDGGGSAVNRYVKRLAITQALIRKLPSVASFRQKMHGGVGDALPFQAEGYHVEVQFTFEIPPASSASIWSSMRDKTRNVIRRAQECLSVRECSDPDLFFHLATGNLAKKNKQPNVDFGVCRTLAMRTLERGQGHILVARDRHGEDKAAIFCVWDSNTYYYLMSTRAPDAGNGAVPLLIWHAIQAAASNGRVFDFDGISNAGSILLFSGFGGKSSPRYIVSKANAPYRLLRQIRRLDGAAFNPFA